MRTAASYRLPASGSECNRHCTLEALRRARLATAAARPLGPSWQLEADSWKLRR